MKLEAYLSIIERFLIDKLAETHMDGYVLGLSGGIDSAVVAGIAHKAVGKKLFCLLLPCDSGEEDARLAMDLVKKFNLSYEIIDLSNSYHVFIKELEEKALASGKPLDKLAHINTKVRLRMVTLYAFAQARHAMVLGTDNWDESYTGYFTKYGDGGVDLLPIVHLTKGEVRLAAKHYGVPQAIIDRAPSAGLYAGQTDESEMGVNYEELDNYLLGKIIDAKKVERIENLHKVSAHKRDPLPRPEKFQRD